MNQEEFTNWLNALDMYEFIDWLLPEILEQELISDLYDEGLNL